MFRLIRRPAYLWSVKSFLGCIACTGSSAGPRHAAPDGDRWIACRPGFFGSPIESSPACSAEIVPRTAPEAVQFRHALRDPAGPLVRHLRQVDLCQYAKTRSSLPRSASPAPTTAGPGRRSRTVRIRLCRWRDYPITAACDPLAAETAHAVSVSRSMSCPRTSTASATSASSPAATASRSSPSAAACSICLHPSPPSLLPTIMPCSSSLSELPCSSARPAAVGACSWWGASSRASPLRRRTPHDHRSLGSTSPTAKTLLSLIRDTCVLPHAAGSVAGTFPTHPES